MIPVTYAMMWIGSSWRFGIPHIGGFAGFYLQGHRSGKCLRLPYRGWRFRLFLGIVAAFMTAFYSWRLIFMTFHGAPRADEKTMAHVHESPKIMLSRCLLAIGRALRGMSRP